MTIPNEHYSWKIDPKSGDYIVENGSPVPSTNLDFPIYARLKTPQGDFTQGGWMYSPDKKFGSTLQSIKKRSSVKGGSLVQNAMINALSPLYEDGRASQIDVDQVGTSRQGEQLSITYFQKSGEQNLFTLQGV